MDDMRIVVTRPRKQAEPFARLLRERGAHVIYLPVIRIAPVEDPSDLDGALQRLDHYDWLIFTSVNGVEAVWERFSALGTAPPFDSVLVAAIGPKTAAALERRGVAPSFVPHEYLAEAILPGLGDIQGRRFLLARADIARAALPRALREAGGEVDDVTCYRTVMEQPERAALDEVAAGVEMVTFTSPSTVEHFVQLMRAEGLEPTALPGDPAVACIGPVTARRAQELGLKVDIVPESYTAEGLLEAMVAFRDSATMDAQ